MTPACQHTRLLLMPLRRGILIGRVAVIIVLASLLGIGCNGDFAQSGALPFLRVTQEKLQSPSPHTQTAEVPISLHAAYMWARQNEASAEHTFTPVAGFNSTLQAQNFDQGLEVRLDPFGLRLRSTRTLRASPIFLALTSYGCAKAMNKALLVAPKFIAGSHRVEYLRQDITEWYVNGPLGLEHGFTVDRDPGCGTGKLIFSLTLKGDVKATIEDHNTGSRIIVRDLEASEQRQVLVYGNLFALDADGKELPSRMLLTERTVQLEIDAVGARYPVIVDPLWTEQSKLVASDGAGGDRFGWSVAMDGETAIIGAPDKQVGHTGFGQGQAYVYVRSGGSWLEQAKLVSSDGTDSDHFATSVAISGDTAVVGAPGKSFGATHYQGQVYVFVRTGNTWSEEAKLVALDGAYDDEFGSSVAVSEDTAVIGAPTKLIGGKVQGQVYVYVRSGGSWSEQARLVGSDGARGDSFGSSVAISMDNIIIGAPGKNVGLHRSQGQAYAYNLYRGFWSERAKLISSDGAAYDWFGYSVAVNGKTAVVGAYQKQVGSNNCQGQAYVYVRSGSEPSTAVWMEQARLVGTDGLAGDFFGYAVAVNGDTVVIGAPGKTLNANEQQGQGYVYIRSGISWSEKALLNGVDGATADGAGSSVATSGQVALIGASSKAVSGRLQGQAYIFR